MISMFLGKLMAFNKKLFPHIVLLRLAAFIVVMLYNSYKIYQGLLIAAEENGSLFLLIVLSEKTTCCQGKICLFSLFFQEVISLELNLSHKVFQFSCFRKGHQWASCEGIKPTEIWSHMLEVKQMLISICKILSFFLSLEGNMTMIHIYVVSFNCCLFNNYFYFQVPVWYSF